MDPAVIKQGHRALGTCATCVYSEMNGDQGQCRKSPPSIFGEYKHNTGWPEVWKGDWCGEHRAEVVP
jgi:hypothetical protein